jgi:hypothetical protein
LEKIGIKKNDNGDINKDEKKDFYRINIDVKKVTW